MSRSTILSHVRSANQGRKVPPARPPADPRPAFDAAKNRQAFVARMTACGVVVEELGSVANVPEAVLRYVTAARLPLTLRHGTDGVIAAMPWDRASSLQRTQGAAHPDDQAALSRAIGGVAETGTLLLGSGTDNPVTLAFLPDLHIVVLDSASIVATLDDAFRLARNAGLDRGSPAQELPRTLNFISGASRTGDIGGRLVMGAHGPRQLVVLLTG